MTLRKMLLVILSMSLFISLSAAPLNAQNQKPENKKAEKEKDDDDADDTPEGQRELARLAKISKEDAARTALQKTPGDILESELDRETGRLDYEFKIRDKGGKIWEVRVDATTGEFINALEETEDDDDDEDSYESSKAQKKLAKEAKISRAEARSIALRRIPGEVLEIELDKERGKVVYDIEIRDSNRKIWEVQVDAKTSEIVGVAEDDDGGEGDDDDKPSDQQVKTDQGKWYEFWRKIPGLRKKKTEKS